MILPTKLIKITGAYINKHRQKTDFLATADIDMMTGLEFERYVADKLQKRGYTRISLTEAYDLGVDSIAVKDGGRWGIPVKRYSGLIGAEAVRQVVTALPYYKCDRGMVITNSWFSKPAVVLAASNRCVLTDRQSIRR